MINFDAQNENIFIVIDVTFYRKNNVYMYIYLLLRYDTVLEICLMLFRF